MKKRWRFRREKQAPQPPELTTEDFTRLGEVADQMNACWHQFEQVRNTSTLAMIQPLAQMVESYDQWREAAVDFLPVAEKFNLAQRRMISDNMKIFDNEMTYFRELLAHAERQGWPNKIIEEVQQS